VGLLLSAPPAAQRHGEGTASAWVQRWSHLVAPGASVLDVACGHGRHLRWFAARGHTLVGVDRSREALDASFDLQSGGRAELVQADIEHDPWPLRVSDGSPRGFGAVVVTNYLWRPLLPVIRDSVAPGGVLLYETFAIGNDTVGKPARPDFLLRTGELLQVCAGFHVVAYENGFCEAPSRFVQRIAAVRPGRAPGAGADGLPAPPRYPL